MAFAPRSTGSHQDKKRERPYHTKCRFPERAENWDGRLIDYKEVEMLRKFMTASSKVMSRKRAGTNAAEQRALKRALKNARYMALLPFTGT